jgi:endonuclease-8
VPEGDTVWRTARRLDQALSGRILATSDFRVPAWAETDLVGQTVVETVSRGKHLLTRLPDVTIHTHLKMEGSWHIYRPGSRWRSPSFQARLILANAEWTAVGFRLGTVEIVERGSEHLVVGHLGPDLLDDDCDLGLAVERLASQPARPIGEALLDQRNLAGIGNIYKTEVCFLFGLHPAAPVGDIDDLDRVVARAQALLVANRERAEQSTTGNLSPAARFWIYGRRGEPCRRCGTTIVGETLVATADSSRRADPNATPSQDESRFSAWCPTCQPDPANIG